MPYSLSGLSRPLRLLAAASASASLIALASTRPATAQELTWSMHGATTQIASQHVYASAASAAVHFFPKAQDDTKQNIVSPSYFVVNGRFDGRKWWYSYSATMLAGTTLLVYEIASDHNQHTRLLAVGEPTAQEQASLDTRAGGQTANVTSPTTSSTSCPGATYVQGHLQQDFFASYGGAQFAQLNTNESYYWALGQICGQQANDYHPNPASPWTQFNHSFIYYTQAGPYAEAATNNSYQDGVCELDVHGQALQGDSTGHITFSENDAMFSLNGSSICQLGPARTGGDPFQYDVITSTSG